MTTHDRETPEAGFAGALHAPDAREPDTAAPAPAGGDHRSGQRRRILSAAMACFARDGFHGASMQKICAEAGMSPGALYRYFPSKEAIIAAIVEGESAERRQIFDQIERSPSVLAGLAECLRQLLQEPSLTTAVLGPEIMAEAIRNTKLREAIEPCEEETRERLAAMLRQAVAQGEIDPALDLAAVMFMLQVIGDGIILHHNLHPEWNLPGRLGDFDALVRRMLAPRSPVRE